MRYDGYLNLRFLSCFLLLNGLMLTKFFYNLDNKKNRYVIVSWQNIIFLHFVAFYHLQKMCIAPRNRVSQFPLNSQGTVYIVCVQNVNNSW